MPLRTAMGYAYNLLSKRLRLRIMNGDLKLWLKVRTLQRGQYP